MTKYWRYNARLGCFGELTENEFKKAVSSKYVIPVYDDYFQKFSESTYYDCRDRIVSIFYIRTEGSQ